MDERDAGFADETVGTGRPTAVPLAPEHRELAEHLLAAPDAEALELEAQLVEGTDNQGEPPDDEE